MAKKKSKAERDFIKFEKSLERRENLLKKLTTEQVMAAVIFIDGDGHTICPESALVEKCKWPADIAHSVCQAFESDLSDPKSTIFDNEGKPVAQMYGWYCLDVLRSLASAFNVTYEGAMGRGFQARLIDKALRKHFNQEVKA